MMHVLLRRIQVVNDCLRIANVACSEYDDFEFFAEFLQNLSSKRTHVDASLEYGEFLFIQKEWHIKNVPVGTLQSGR